MWRIRLFLIVLLSSSQVHAQDTLPWVGRKVVTKYQTPLGAEDQVLNDDGVHRVYTVERQSGQSLWIASEGVAGWVMASAVVPAAEAIDFYTKEINENHQAHWAYGQRGSIWFDKGEYDKAIADYSESIRINPKNAVDYDSRGCAWGMKKDYDKAIADFNESIKIDPRYALAYGNRGMVWKDKREIGKAIADWNEAIRLEPKFVGALLYRGCAWAEKGEYDRALADLDEALRLDPTNTLALKIRGWVWWRKKQPDKAIIDYNDAARLDPKDDWSENSRAWIWATCPDPKLRDGKKAVESAMSACQLSDWKNTEYLGTLAAAYAEHGDFSKAVELQEKLNQLCKDAEDRKQGEDRLKLFKEKKPYRDESMGKVAEPPSKRRLEHAEPAGTVESIKASVLLLGRPGVDQATGFVISRKNRLVATAAHVADDELGEMRALFAVPNGRSEGYLVDKVWYHPATIRKLGGGLYARSTDPNDGEFAHRSPDVAVLHLAPGGPDLPAEVALADDQELSKADRQAIVSIGFPGRIEDRWPTASRPANAAVVNGEILKMFDEFDQMNVPIHERRAVWYSPGLEGGLSGAPVFLENGHVIAIACQEHIFRNGDTLSRGYRVDCLRDLLAYYGLDEPKPGAEQSTTTHPDWGPDPHIHQYRQAVRNVREADGLRRAGDYVAASQKCNDAIGLAPDYAGAYLQRSKVYLYYCGANWNRLGHEERLRYAQWSSDDSLKCIELLPDWTLPYLICLQNSVYVSLLRNDPDGFRREIQTVDEFLTSDWPREPFTDQDRSFAINCRAQCHQFLGHLAEAEPDYNESIRLDPDEPRWYSNRALFRDQHSRAELADADHREAENLRRKRILAASEPSASPETTDTQGSSKVAVPDLPPEATESPFDARLDR